MNITIGRNPASTIPVSDSYDTVSYDHAEIFMDGVNIKFMDHSSNGTIINNQKIQNMSVNIYRGDVIRLAGKYVLGWNVIEQFIQTPGRVTVTRNPHGELPPPTGRAAVQSGLAGGASRETQLRRPPVQDEPRYGGGVVQPEEPRSYPEYSSANRLSAAEEKEIDGWNWGAFFFGWIWGVFNKVYVALIQLVCNVVVFFVKGSGLLTAAAVFQLASLGIAIWLGVKGSRLAWNQNAYDSFEHFKRVRHGWNVAALITFCVLVVVFILSLILFMDIISRLV